MALKYQQLRLLRTQMATMGPAVHSISYFFLSNGPLFFFTKFPATIVTSE